MRIKVKVRPSSGRQEIEKVSDEEYKVWLKGRAEDGKANLELLKMLKKYFGKDVRIVSGFTSRNKVVEID
jgi:uncharacterized protein (TIGR00251 family)